MTHEQRSEAEHKLRPCPFCGSKATINTMLIEPPDWWAACASCDGVMDHKCSCQMISQGDTEQQSIDNLVTLWNRRAQ